MPRLHHWGYCAMLVVVVHRHHSSVRILVTSPPLEVYIAPFWMMAIAPKEEDF